MNNTGNGVEFLLKVFSMARKAASMHFPSFRDLLMSRTEAVLKRGEDVLCNHEFLQAVGLSKTLRRVLGR